jgi:predicted transcriptional regulator
MLQSYIRRAKRNGFLVNKNRDRVSIVGDILETVCSGAKKTHIMFSVGLSFSLLNKYLDLVIKAGFVRLEGSIYFLTEHGKEFLTQYQRFEERYFRAQSIFEALSVEHEQLSGRCIGTQLS